MKYLILDVKHGGDWHLDLLFAGLVKVVGHENVIDFPHKVKHREWDASKIGQDYYLERRTFGYTEYNSLIKSDLNYIKELAKKGELICITDERDDNFDFMKRLKISCPTVILAGHDRFWNDKGPYGVQQMYGDNFLWMFIDQHLNTNVINASHINLSTNFDHQWNRPVDKPKKEFDICFFGYVSHPTRKVFIDAIRNHPVFGKLNNKIILEEESNTAQQFLTKEYYLNVMLRSKICLNLRGGSDRGHTMRFYEIPYVGSFMLSNKPEYKQLYPYIHGEHCLYFDDINTLYSSLAFALRNEKQREEMALAGHKFTLENQTCENRARYVLDTIANSKRCKIYL